MSKYIQSLVKGNQTLTEKIKQLENKINELEIENRKLVNKNNELGEKLYKYESIKKKKPDIGLAVLNSLFINPAIQSPLFYNISKLEGDDINE